MNGFLKFVETYHLIKDVWCETHSNVTYLLKNILLCFPFKEEIKKRKTTMGVIPGGCRKVLQPLDESINKPFKGFFRELYDE